MQGNPGPDNRRHLANCLNSIGLALMRESRFAEALPYFTEQATLWKEAFEKRGRATEALRWARACFRKGEIALQQGRFADAIKQLEQALRLRTEHGGGQLQEKIELAENHFLLFYLCLSEEDGRRQDGLTHLREAIRILAPLEEQGQLDKKQLAWLGNLRAALEEETSGAPGK